MYWLFHNGVFVQFISNCCVCVCAHAVGLVLADSPQRKKWTTLQINAFNRSPDSERWGEFPFNTGEYLTLFFPFVPTSLEFISRLSSHYLTSFVCLSVHCGRWFRKASIWRASSGHSTRLLLLPGWPSRLTMLRFWRVVQPFLFPASKHAQTSYWTWSLFVAHCRFRSVYCWYFLTNMQWVLLNSCNVL